MHTPLSAVSPALVVARAVRGIEPLVAAEVHCRGLGTVRELRHREVWFETTAPSPALLALRTADDVLLAAAVVDGIGPDRSALRRLARAARDLDTALTGPGVRCPGGSSCSLTPAGAPGLEVSASFVGRRAYTRFEIEDAVGEELGRRLGLPYHSRAGGGVPPFGSKAWRVTIEGERALIALRASGRPLHRRPYKIGSIAGTLHPPLAAAMAELGGLGTPGELDGLSGLSGLGRPGGALTVLDPCCGAGTTLIEASVLAPDARLIGLDHDPGAVATAAANSARMLASAGAADLSPADPPPADHPSWDVPTTHRLVGHRPMAGPLARDRPVAGRPAWGVADAGRMPVADGSVDRVLVNPPWGLQVPPAGLLARDPGRLWRQVRRVLAGDGLVVALLHGMTEDPTGFASVRRVEVSLSGRHPVIAVLRKQGRAG